MSVTNGGPGRARGCFQSEEEAGCLSEKRTLREVELRGMATRLRSRMDASRTQSPSETLVADLLSAAWLIKRADRTAFNDSRSAMRIALYCGIILTLGICVW